MFEEEKKKVYVGAKVISCSDNRVWDVTKQIDRTHFEVQRLSVKGKPLVQILSLDNCKFRLPTNVYEFETTIRIKVFDTTEERARKRLPLQFYDEDEYEYECSNYLLVNMETDK